MPARKELPDAEIVRRYLAGETADSIAFDYEVSNTLIYNRLRAKNVAIRHGGKGRPRKLEGHRLKQALEMYAAADYTVAEIAAMFDLHVRVLHRYAARAGIMRTARGLVGKNATAVQEITTVEQIRSRDCGDE